MTLGEIIKKLNVPGMEILSGDPRKFELLRVAEYQDGNSPITSGTLFLIGSKKKLRNLPAIIAKEEDIALLVPKSVARTLPPDWIGSTQATIVLCQGKIPLDLSARIQRMIDLEAGPLLSAGAISLARQDLVEDLILGRYRDIAALHSRSRALGMPISHARVVVIVGFDNFERFYLQNESKGELFFQQTKGQILQLSRREGLMYETSAVITPHGEGAVVLLSKDPAPLGEALAQSLRKEMRFVPVTVALGGVKPSVEELAQSYQEAQLALQLKRRLRVTSRSVAFSQVTGFALLQQLQFDKEVSTLLLGELQPLLAAEHTHRPVLIETMAAYFDSGSSLKRAGERLKVHPKTLRYRLDRIEDILGLSALEGDRRLLYHLAAKYYLWINDLI